VVGTAGDLVWTGTLSSDWTNPGNWSRNAIPTATDAVVIPAGTPNLPSVNSGLNAVCKSLRLNAGATVIVASCGNLNIAQ
jgi:hypothetical protein